MEARVTKVAKVSARFSKSLARRRLRPNQEKVRDPYVYIYYFAAGACHLFLGHVDQAIDLFRKARAANPRVFYLHLWLAGALGLNGDLDEARAALAESLKLKPEANSLAAWRAATPWITYPPYWALREKTVNVGLRRAGFPEE
jgi:adenylate cyclase